MTCGGATAYRSRTCNNPRPKYDGLPCEGPTVNSTLCSTYPCPSKFIWDAFPTPRYDGLYPVKDLLSTQLCFLPIHAEVR